MRNSKLRSETEFSAEFRKELGGRPFLDLVQMETKLDDGLPDYMAISHESKKITFIELKIGFIQGGALKIPTLQTSQINFLHDRITDYVQSLILVEALNGIFCIKVEKSLAWKRVIVSRAVWITDPIISIVRYDNLREMLV